MDAQPDHADPEQQLAALYERRSRAIPLRPEPAPGAVIAKCHDNAAAFCASQPGYSVVTGWILLGIGWDRYLFCPHSIVRDGAGRLRDVTPQNDPGAELPFLPDNSTVLRKAIEARIGSYTYPPIPEAGLLEVIAAPAGDEDGS